MELVYLWVDSYKNIEKQGFNFSPRFHCEYDEETNELTINENEDYISDFFGENINVTAIVGKNGSGKSSVLEVISEFIESEPRKGLLWIEDNNKIIQYNYNSDNYYKTILFSDNEIAEISHYNHINYFLKEKTHLASMKKIENLLISLFSYKENLSYISELDYLPTHIKLKIDKKIPQKIKDLLIKELSAYGNNFGSLDVIHKIIRMIGKNLIGTHRKNNYEIENYFYIKDFIMKIANIHQSHCSLVFSIIKEIIESKDFINNEEIDLAKILREKIYHQNDKFNMEDSLINFVKEFIGKKYPILYEDEYESYIIDLKEDNLEKLLLISQRQYFDLLFYKEKNDKKIYYDDLSSGEKIFINFFSKLYYSFYPYNISRFFSMAHHPFTKGGVDDKILILLDEPDINLHPYWQKNFISYLIQFLIKTIDIDDVEIHIILTTHSPFILSDLPEQNIIFLEKDENGNCKVVDGLNEKKQTFGANIHTLLTDSFFMKDGLMGEFAKQKINEIIDFFNNKNEIYKEEKAKLKKVIEAIGEPFLKDKLLRMYDEKYPKTDDEKIQVLEAEIKKIKNDKN